MSVPSDYSVVSRTLVWVAEDGTWTSQTVTLCGPGELDDSNKGDWKLTNIGDVVGGTGNAPSTVMNIAMAFIPWWLYEGQNPQPPLNPVPKIPFTDQSTGGVKPYFY